MIFGIVSRIGVRLTIRGKEGTAGSVFHCGNVTVIWGWHPVGRCLLNELCQTKVVESPGNINPLCIITKVEEGGHDFDELWVILIAWIWMGTFMARTQISHWTVFFFIFFGTDLVSLKIGSAIWTFTSQWVCEMPKQILQEVYAKKKLALSTEIN